MKVSKYSPQTNTPLFLKPAPRPRSPEEVEKAQHSEIAAHAAIAAAIDFLNTVEDDALRKHTAHLLKSNA